MILSRQLNSVKPLEMVVKVCIVSKLVFYQQRNGTGITCGLLLYGYTEIESSFDDDWVLQW